MMYALVFGNVTAIVQRAYARRATFHMKTNDLKDFYHTHNIPKPLKHRIQEYFQSMWTMNNGINFNEVGSSPWLSPLSCNMFCLVQNITDKFKHHKNY